MSESPDKSPEDVKNTSVQTVYLLSEHVHELTRKIEKLDEKLDHKIDLVLNTATAIRERTAAIEARVSVLPDMSTHLGEIREHLATMKGAVATIPDLTKKTDEIREGKVPILEALNTRTERTERWTRIAAGAIVVLGWLGQIFLLWFLRSQTTS